MEDSSFIYNPGPIYLQALNDGTGSKRMQVLSSVVEADLKGDFYYSTLGNDIKHLLHQHLPSLIPEPKQAETGLNKFDLDLQVKNSEDLSYAFGLPAYNVENATLIGEVDMTSEIPLQLEGYLPRVMVGGSDFRETRLNLLSNSSTGVDLDLLTYLVQKDGYINLRLLSKGVSDQLSNSLSYVLQQPQTESVGEIKVTMNFCVIALISRYLIFIFTLQNCSLMETGKL